MRSLVDIADETIFRFRFGEYRRAVEKALKKEHQHQPTAMSEHFAVTGHAIFRHSVNDLQMIPLELINSNRDMICKARKSYLTTIANTLDSYGMNTCDEI